MRSSLLLTTLVALTTAASVPHPLEQRTKGFGTLNDIDEMCSANFANDPKAIICVKDGASTTFVTADNSYLRGNDDHICCEADNTCMVSNHTIPKVACYEPKYVNIPRTVARSMLISMAFQNQICPDCTRLGAVSDECCG